MIFIVIDFTIISNYSIEAWWVLKVNSCLNKRFCYYLCIFCFNFKYLLEIYVIQDEAAIAYDLAALEYKGPNAITNFDISRYANKVKTLQEMQSENPKSSTKKQVNEPLRTSTRGKISGWAKRSKYSHYWVWVTRWL